MHCYDCGLAVDGDSFEYTHTEELGMFANRP